MYRTLAAILVAGSVAVAVPLADVWDVAGDNDDGNGTDNELMHGTEQVHDLGVRPGPAADFDCFSIGQQPPNLVGGRRRQHDRRHRLQQQPAAAGRQHRRADHLNGISITPGLRLQPQPALPQRREHGRVRPQYVRVGPGGCGTSCDGNDVYHIRARETTISIARFNNSGSQVTVLLTQNVTDLPINATFFYWSTTGTLLQTGGLALAAKSLNVFAYHGFGPWSGRAATSPSLTTARTAA